MKINYKVNEQNVLTYWQSIPFNESEPYIEIEDENELILNYTQIIDGKIVNTLTREEILAQEKQEWRQNHSHELIISKIRERYTLDDELAILRQRDTKPEEFEVYNAYVENCKAEIKTELNL